MTILALSVPLAAMGSPFSDMNPPMLGERMYILEGAIRLCLADPNGKERYQQLMIEWVDLINEIKRNPNELDSNIATIEQYLTKESKGGEKYDELRPTIVMLARILELRSTLFPTRMPLIEATSTAENSAMDKPISWPPRHPKEEVLPDPALKQFLGTYAFKNGIATFFFDGWNINLYEGPTPQGLFGLIVPELGRTTVRPGYTFFDPEVKIESKIVGNTFFKTTTTTTWNGHQTIEERKLVKNGPLLILSIETREYKKNFITRNLSEVSRQIAIREFTQTSERAMTLEQFQRATHNRPRSLKYIGGLGRPMGGMDLRAAYDAGLLVPDFDGIPPLPNYLQECEEELE